MLMHTCYKELVILPKFLDPAELCIVAYAKIMAMNAEIMFFGIL